MLAIYARVTRRDQLLIDECGRFYIISESGITICSQTDCSHSKMAAVAPVQQHREWRHLQRAAVAAHRSLLPLSREAFSALFTAPASLALWILQHAPELARKPTVRLLIVNPAPLHLLDCGRWLGFIPWLVGRPELRIEATLLLSMGPENEPAEDRVRLAQMPRQDLERQLQCKDFAAARHLKPAQIRFGTVAGWLTCQQQEPSAVDLCALFSPVFSANWPELLVADGLIPLLRGKVPLALFSASDADQLVDVFTLRAAGLEPRDTDSWSNPWALPIPGATPMGQHAAIGWSGDFDIVPDVLGLQTERMATLKEALDFVEEDLKVGGADSLLTMGAPISVSAAGKPTTVLWRLPRGVAVDASTGDVLQLQDDLALPLPDAPVVAQSVLATYPGGKDLLERAIWATTVYRRHIAPAVQTVDEALKEALLLAETAHTG